MPPAAQIPPPLPPAAPQSAPARDAAWTHPRYVLFEQLGSGGMGQVYRAKDRLTDTWVALKRVNLLPSRPAPPPISRTTSVEETLPPQTGMSQIDERIAGPRSPYSITQDATFLPHEQPLRPSTILTSDTISSLSLSPLSLALAREFRTLASLRHPNIVSVFDYGFESPEQPFFTMELLTGAEPFLRVCRGRDVVGRVRLLIEVLAALAYLHRRGILHRDLKPGNVLFCEERVVVLDFGLSTLRSMTQGGSAELSGTLHYMAPELLVGQAASEASDLYAFGVMATQVLTGKRPFDADQSELLIARVLNDEPSLPMHGLSAAILRVLEQLLARNPAQRLSDATQAARALAQAADIALPDETAQVRESYLQAADFVGRDQELGVLRSALHQAQRGHGGLWLIGGESGVGKSRLLDELRTLALVRGAHVDRGQAVTETGSAYQVFLDALHSAALSVPLSPLEEGTLARVLPDLPTLLEKDIAPPPELDAAAARARLQAVLCDLLLRRSEPTVLILEDLHWAAPESRELLARLLPHLDKKPLLILASYRDDECPQLPDELPGAQTLALQRLGPRGTAELIESMLGAAGQRPDLVQWLSEQTEGNPFFLVEILRALAEEAGSLTRIGLVSDMASGHSAGLRGGMALVVRRRLSRLPSWALPAVQQAAIAGRRIDRALMRALMSASEAELDRWLAACADAAVLDVQNEHWQFSHDKLREGVLASLRAEQTQALHRDVALGIERSRPLSGDVAAALAFHYQHGGEPARAFHFALLASDAATQRGALREALSLLRQAQSLESLATPLRLARVRLRRLLGTTLLGLGHIDECMQITEDGLALLDQPLPVSSRQLAFGLLENLALQAALRVNDVLPGPHRLPLGADSLSPDEGREALSLLVTHAEVALYLFSDRRLFFCSLALANLADRLDDVPQRITSYGALAYTSSTFGLSHIADLYLSKAAALRETVRGTAADYKFLRLRSSLLISRGQLAEAELDLRQADAIAQAVFDSTSRLVALQQLVWIAIFRDQLRDGSPALQALVQVAEREGHGQFIPRARISQAQVLQQRGQHREAVNVLDAALIAVRERRDLTFELQALQLHARSNLALGQIEAARADCDVLLSIFSSSPIFNYGVLPAAVGLVEVCFGLLERAQPLLRAQRRAQLDRALAVLKRMARHHRIAQPSWLRAQARLLRRSGAPTHQADALEQQAAQQAKAMGIP